jgi:hypothetical protein
MNKAIFREWDDADKDLRDRDYRPGGFEHSGRGRDADGNLLAPGAVYQASAANPSLSRAP